MVAYGKVHVIETLDGSERMTCIIKLGDEMKDTCLGGCHLLPSNNGAFHCQQISNTLLKLDFV